MTHGIRSVNGVGMELARLADLTDPAKTPLLVVKIGSALLVENGEARREWLDGLVAELAALHAKCQRIIIVSSGAIALGASRLALAKGGRASLPDAQAAASVGQIALASLWSDKLAAHGLPAAQMLLSLGDLEDRRRYLNAASTITRLLEAGAVPVINENDSVATEEIRFGDNDRLAARVAQAARAKGVVLLSDVDGLYDRNPAEKGAKLVEVVRGVDKAIRDMADMESASGLGSGGMAAKLQAAQIAERAGILLAIINGTHARPIARALDSNRGTIFMPMRRDTARKSWIGGRQSFAGTIQVDEGCMSALREGKSLLAAGVVAVEGDFVRGDAVTVNAPDGCAIAQGLIEYDAATVEQLLGKRSEEHEAILGHAPRPAVIHADHLVLL